MKLIPVGLGLLGLFIGSFLNVCVYRLPRGLPIATGRSRCGACGHELGPLDLVPVLSWLLLRGRCRHCGARFSGRYALGELLTAVLFCLTAWVSGVDVRLLPDLFLVGVLLVGLFLLVDRNPIPKGMGIWLASLVLAGALLEAGREWGLQSGACMLCEPDLPAWARVWWWLYEMRTLPPAFWPIRIAPVWGEAAAVALVFLAGRVPGFSAPAGRGPEAVAEPANAPGQGFAMAVWAVALLLVVLT